MLELLENPELSLLELPLLKYRHNQLVLVQGRFSSSGEARYYYIGGDDRLHGSGLEIHPDLLARNDLIEINQGGDRELVILVRGGDLYLSTGRLLFRSVETIESSNEQSYVLKFTDGSRLDRQGQKEHTALLERVLPPKVDCLSIGGIGVSGYVKEGVGYIVWSASEGVYEDVVHIVELPDSGHYDDEERLYQTRLPDTDYVRCSQQGTEVVYFYRADGSVSLVPTTFIHDYSRDNIVRVQELQAPSSIQELYGVECLDPSFEIDDFEIGPIPPCTVGGT